MTRVMFVLALAVSACKGSAKKLPDIPPGANIELRRDGDDTIVIDTASGYRVRMAGVPDDVSVDTPNPASGMGPSVLVAKNLDRGLLIAQVRRLGKWVLDDPAALDGFYAGMFNGARDFGGGHELERKVSDVTIAGHPGKLLEATVEKDGRKGRLRMGAVYVAEKHSVFAMTATVADDASAEDAASAEHWIGALAAR